jgi:enoyl-[acyl-carrier protein] reductase I
MLSIDLTGKAVFIAGIADDQGFGFAIAKALYKAGAQIYVGTWPPVFNLFTKSLEKGKFDESMTYEDGSKMEFKKIIPLDATFDNNSEIPAEVREDKRYKLFDKYSIADAASIIKEELGDKKLDYLIHSLANGPDVKKPLLQTSRSGYLSALSASSYSKVSMCQHFGPIMNGGGSIISLTYLAGEKCIPGYGGGMSTAKAALDSDTKVLAYECGRAYGLRVNTISAGPLGSRAAKAIGFIERILDYSTRNQPLAKVLKAEEVANTAAFLCSDLSSAITGSVVYVDNGFHAMGVPVSERGVQGGDLTSIHVQEGNEPYKFNSEYTD